MIAVYRDGRWDTIPFTGATNHYWSHVYRGYRNRDHLYALSSGYCGEPSGQLYLYRSVDGGRYWTVSSIDKPYYLAEFLSLRMEPDGTGEIIVQTLNDADPIGGHYVYRTTDFGETWSEPEFSENTLTIPARPDTLARTREQAPITKIMEDIVADYERYRQRP